PMHYRGTRMVCMRRRWQRSTEYLVTFVRAARSSISLQERRLTRRCSRPLKSAAAERQAVSRACLVQNARTGRVSRLQEDRGYADDKASRMDVRVSFDSAPAFS